MSGYSCLLTGQMVKRRYNSYMEWAASNLSAVNAEIDAYAMWPHNTQPIMWHMLLISTPQGGSTSELLIGTGGSLILFGVLCMVGNKYGKVLKIFCSAGKLSLMCFKLCWDGHCSRSVQSGHWH